MASPGVNVFPVTLIALVLLFVPGLIGLDIYYRSSETNPSISRAQRIVYSTTVSIASLFVLYILSPLIFQTIVPLSSSIADYFSFVTLVDLQRISLSGIVSIYLAHFTITILIGYFVGSYVEEHSDGPRDRREPWRYAFEKVPQQGELIEVVMTDGTIVHGGFVKAAWDQNRRELFLDSPYKVTYEQDGVSIASRDPLGRNVLINEQSLSRVVFLESDPQSQLADQFTEDMEEIRDKLEDLGYMEEASGQSSIESFDEDDDNQSELE